MQVQRLRVPHKLLELIVKDASAGVDAATAAAAEEEVAVLVVVLVFKSVLGGLVVLSALLLLLFLLLDDLQPLSVVELELLALDPLCPGLVDLGNQQYLRNVLKTLMKLSHLPNEVKRCIADLLHLRVLVVHEVDEVGDGVGLAQDKGAGLLVGAQKVEHIYNLKRDNTLIIS